MDMIYSGDLTTAIEAAAIEEESMVISEIEPSKEEPIEEVKIALKDEIELLASRKKVLETLECEAPMPEVPPQMT